MTSRSALQKSLYVILYVAFDSVCLIVNLNHLKRTVADLRADLTLLRRALDERPEKKPTNISWRNKNLTRNVSIGHGCPRLMWYVFYKRPITP